MYTKMIIMPYLLLAIISSISAQSRCTKILTTDDNQDVHYSCLQATSEQIYYIPDGVQSIRFSISVLLPLPARAFARFTQLRKLSFYNSEIMRIDAKAFDGLEKLQRLTFYGTNINEVKSSWFNNMPNLTHLSLVRNDIIYIEPYAFSRLSNLIYLNMEDNNLNCLPGDILSSLTKLKRVRIGKNPWLCSCYKKIIGLLEDRGIQRENTNAMKRELGCMMEDVTQIRDYTLPFYGRYKNISVFENGYIQINAGQNFQCIGGNISVLSPIPNNVQSLKLINSKIPKIPRLAFLRFGNSLTTLYISNCGIREIHPEAFAGLSKLEELYLYNNSFTLVQGQWFRDLHNLQYLVLEKNNINHILASAFPLLSTLKYLSLSNNNLQCISTTNFDSLKNLKEVLLIHNPWRCDCQDNFRRWLHEHRVRYVISRGPCVDGQIEDSEDLFEQIFEERDAGVNSQTTDLAYAASLPEEINPDDDELYDQISADFETCENQFIEIYYNRDIEIANREYDQELARKRAYYKTHAIPTKYMGFEETAQLDFFPRYIDFFSPNYQLIDIVKNSTYACVFMKVSPGSESYSYVSDGGVLWDASTIPTEAMAIRFQNSAIPNIFSGILSRFSNTLQVLEFLHCAVQDIEPQAFNNLANLQELVINDNQIQEIRAAWFEDTPNLRKLSLSRNSIVKIDNGVFKLLPNLEQLEISGNKLNCLQFDALLYLTKLTTMYIGDNPWSCLCKKNLDQWLREHKILYDESALTEKVDWNCSEDYESSETNNIQDMNSFIDAEVDADGEIENIQMTQDSKVDEGSIMTKENLIIIQTEDQKIDLNLSTPKVQETVPTLTTVEPENFEGQCRLHPTYQYKNRWLCSGGSVLVVDHIPNSAERIEFSNAHIPFIPAYLFARFSNLTGLLFYSSGIRYIHPLAFSSSNKLETLIFFNNSLPIIRSSWFCHLRNVTLLGLARNSVEEIEPDVFNFLPNLHRLAVQNNKLRCLYTKSLSSSKNLKRVSIHNNPWKWRCQEELIQYFEARNIGYLKSGDYTGRCVVSDVLKGY